MFDEHQHELLRRWITPTPIDVASFRSQTVDALRHRPRSRRDLEIEFGVDRGDWTVDVGNFDDAQSLVGDVLTADDPRIESVRLHMAFREAVHQLEGDRIIEHPPSSLPELRVSGGEITGSTTRGFTERWAAQDDSLLRLTSSARGWTADDHEAFDPAAYQLPPRAALVTPDGEALLREALDAHRFERYLSSTIVLGVFAETAWNVAARRVAGQSSTLSQLLSGRAPAISAIQDEVVQHLVTARQRYLADNLDAWARSMRTVRNAGAHGNVLGATSGSFTASSSAVRIMDCYRNLAELEQALRAIGV